jgi:hypothetical protein
MNNDESPCYFIIVDRFKNGIRGYYVIGLENPFVYGYLDIYGNTHTKYGISEIVMKEIIKRCKIKSYAIPLKVLGE